MAWACERCSDNIVGKSTQGTGATPYITCSEQRPSSDTGCLDAPHVFPLERSHPCARKGNVYGNMHQATSSECETTIKEQEMNIYLDCSVLDSLPVSDIKLLQIKEAQDEDPICKQGSNR